MVDGHLSPLQLALANSMFGGRVKLDATSVMGDFQTQCKAKWAQRAVPEALDQFLTDNLPSDQSIPKGKDARCALFWSTLSSLS